jgi:hypothetical protein
VPQAVRVLALVILVALSFAGCTSNDKPATSGPATASKLQAGLITPGTWIVNSDRDHVLMWVHNAGNAKTDIEWRIELADGSAVPAGWNLTSASKTATLQPNGTKRLQDQRSPYPDWAWSLLTIQIPASTVAGDHELRLNTGHSTHPFTMKITANRTRVSHPNDKVTLNYAGKFNDSGKTFDSGSFDTTLASDETVPGFSFGLIGLALHEKATLILPPPLGYGYDQTRSGYTQFNGKTLRFDVEITKFG